MIIKFHSLKVAPQKTLGISNYSALDII